MKVKILKKNGEPMWKNQRTRLKFSIGVIIANFIAGIIGMLLGADLTALGVFLSMANAPLYVYVLGQSFAPSKIPDQYFDQAHTGSGGLGTIVKYDNENRNETETRNETMNQTLDEKITTNKTVNINMNGTQQIDNPD